MIVLKHHNLYLGMKRVSRVVAQSRTGSSLPHHMRFKKLMLPGNCCNSTFSKHCLVTLCVQEVKAESRAGLRMDTTLEPFLGILKQLLLNRNSIKYMTTFYLFYLVDRNHKANVVGQNTISCPSMHRFFNTFYFPKLNPPQIAPQVVSDLERSCITMHLGLPMASAALVGGGVGGEGWCERGLRGWCRVT